jgi:hypothetical protein
MTALPSIATVTGGAWPGRENAEATLELTFGLEQLSRLDIVVRDLDAGLIDFPRPARPAREVYLCWLVDEPEITHWHAIEAGFMAASRSSGPLSAATARSATAASRSRSPSTRSRSPVAALDEQRVAGQALVLEVDLTVLVHPGHAVRRPGDEVRAVAADPEAVELRAARRLLDHGRHGGQATRTRAGRCRSAACG